MSEERQYEQWEILQESGTPEQIYSYLQYGEPGSMGPPNIGGKPYIVEALLQRMAQLLGEQDERITILEKRLRLRRTE